MNSNGNFYLSMVFVFLAGALAMWAIVHIATTPPSSKPAVTGSEGSYSSLQNVILK